MKMNALNINPAELFSLIAKNNNGNVPMAGIIEVNDEDMKKLFSNEPSESFDNNENCDDPIKALANMSVNFLKDMMGVSCKAKTKAPVCIPGCPEIRKVIYNDPMTIVLWEDGTKTLVTCDKEDKYDRLTGFLLCCLKKAYGKNSAYNDILKAYVWDNADKKAVEPEQPAKKCDCKKTSAKKCSCKKAASAKKTTRVAQIDATSRKVIARFDSIAAAARETGINATSIRKVVKNERKRAGGYLWKSC